MIAKRRKNRREGKGGGKGQRKGRMERERKKGGRDNPCLIIVYLIKQMIVTIWC
jgi:hypothetical protein